MLYKATVLKAWGQYIPSAEKALRKREKVVQWYGMLTMCPNEKSRNNHELLKIKT